jgi:hypothetical protein
MSCKWYEDGVAHAKVNGGKKSPRRGGEELGTDDVIASPPKRLFRSAKKKRNAEAGETLSLK